MDNELGELFVSCSDDQFVRVYKQSSNNQSDDFELLFQFTTKFTNEWHTLTYLALEEGG